MGAARREQSTVPPASTIGSRRSLCEPSRCRCGGPDVFGPPCHARVRAEQPQGVHPLSDMGQLQSYAPFVVRVAQSGPWYPGLHTHLIEEPLGLPCCPRRRERTLACRKQQRSSSPPQAAAASSGGGGGGGRRERVLDGPRYMCRVCKGCERSAQQLCY